MLDPIVAIVVACLILKAAYDLTKSAFFHILDIKLPDDEEAIIHDVMKENVLHFLEYHKLRTRKSGHIRHVDMHLVVPKLMTVEKGHKLSHQISADIENRLDHSHVLVHIEPCEGECDGCVVECPSKTY
jgi:divalent metal cation (Fe/Co/Zn/Cd) transporter